MNDILTQIVEHKREEVAEAKRKRPVEILEAKTQRRLHHSMADSICRRGIGIIAEFKRKSPSKGWIHPNAQIQDVAPLYEAGGAAAMSVLTDSKFFGGSLADLEKARGLVELPILRKDFIIDEYQIVEADAAGADAVLLIASALSPERCTQLAGKATELGLEVLLEIHTEKELEYITPYIKMVGVNNRNLGTFHTDVNNSKALVSKLPKDVVLISESGIACADDIRELKKAGFNGFLIGEMFMKTENPGRTLENLISQLQA